nr:hypothetical protein [uncultured Haemophilus sp.]
MKSTNLYLFDVNAILDVDNTTQNTQFVAGFETFLAKLAGKIQVLVPVKDRQNINAIQDFLAKVNLQDSIVLMGSGDDVCQYINQAYQPNRYLFVHYLNVDKTALRKPTALFIIDKNDDLLPERGGITVADFNVINYLF